MNREEALRSLHIAQKHFDNENYPSSIRFAKKSISLFPTPQAQTLLDRAEELSSGSSSSSSKASTSGVDPTNSSSSSSEGVRQRKAEQSSTSQPTNSSEKNGASPTWTPAQAAVVKRVKTCKVTAYYEILSLEKSCSDADIKKAYRKLALGLHPDKNLAPGAEEAFKMVSKAFQVLSDSNKRAIYDQTGSDPDSRGGGSGGGGGMGNFARRGHPGFGGGGGFGQAEEMSPEDLFRFFFNGGGGGAFGGGGPMGGGFGGPFGGGGGFQFYGPGGIRMQTGGMGGMPRAGGAARANQEPQTTASTLLQIAPLLLFLFISLITQLPSLFFGGGSTPLPEFSFEQTNRFPLRQETHSLHVPYFVNPTQFASHPLYSSYLRANPSLGFNSPNPSDSKLYKRDLVDFLQQQERELQKDKEENRKRPKEELTNEYHKFEKSVESSWINRLQSYCRHEMNNRQDALDRARGFLGIGADYEKIRQLTAQKLPSCEALAQYGYNVRY
ncbi:hypothetical protein JCM5350_007718 [Sporobolomyces pararoseus]